MKTKIITLLFSLFTISMLLSTQSALAIATPTIDTVKSPVDATKQKITGTTEPGAKIVVTGGSYEIAPVTADDNGYFEIKVSLIQESVNQFHFVAEKDGEISESVTVEIVESAEQAQAATGSGIDNIAPKAPEITQTSLMLDETTYKIIGTAEAEATIEISGDAKGETEVDDEGNFSIEIDLQSGKNRITFTAIDESGNMSPGTQITLEITANEGKEEDGTDHGTSTADNTSIALPFPDIESHWAEKYIDQLRNDNIISGYPDGTFGPDNPITRAELTKIALGAFNIIIDENYDANFSDIDESAWYKTYVATAKKKGIIDGYSDGTFGPGNNINRAEALKILIEASRVLKEPGVEAYQEDVAITFPNVKNNDWYYEYVKSAVELDIVGGYPDGTFGPGNDITRAEIAKITVKLMELRESLLSTPSI